MTPTEKRIAAAEAMGWKRAKSTGIIYHGWKSPDGDFAAGIGELPDPEHDDADAMALVQHVAAEGIRIVIETVIRADDASKNKVHWEVMFDYSEMNFVWVTAPDFCTAVLDAFLKMKGKL